MRLHKLYIKNINSLRGEHTIDFDDSILSNCGIFAIIGPTGSGKSTLLDAITLALFNKVPRIGNISNTVIDKEGVILTKYESEAKVKLEYSVGGKHYLSEWSISRVAKSGNLKPHEISIVDLDTGIPLDLKKKQVPEENEKIIGLNYDQFIKSILLSQGEFAKFLKASKNQRGAILEKITGTHLYRDLGIATYRQYKRQAKLLEELLRDIERIQLATPEILHDWQTELKEIDQQHTTLDKQAKKLQVLINSEEKRIKLETSLKKINTESLTLKARKESNQLNQLKLEKHKVIAPLLPDLAIIEDAQRQIDQYHLSLKHQLQTQSTANKALLESINLYQEATQSSTTLETVIDDINQLKRNVDQKKERLQTIQKAGKEETELLKQVQRDYQSIDWDKLITKDKKISLINVTKQIDQLESEITQIPSQYQELSNPTAELNTTRDQRESAKEVLKLKLDKTEKTKNLVAKQTQSDQIKNLLQQAEQALLDLDEKIKTSKELIFNAQVQKEVEMREMDMVQHRQHLQDDQPCPLCGSTHHPYTLDAPKHTNQWEQTINRLLQESESLQKQREILLSQKDTASTKLSTYSEEISILQTEISTIDNKLKSTDTNLSTISPTELEKIDAKIQSITRLIDLQTQFKGLNMAHRYLKRSAIFLDEYYTTQEELKSLYQQESSDFDEFFTSITSRVQTYQKQLIEAQSSIATLERELAKTQQIQQAKEKNILSLAAEHHISSLEVLKSHQLSVALIKEIEHEIAAIKHEETSLLTLRKSITQELKTLNTESTNKPLTELNREATELNTTMAQLSESRGVITQKITENNAKLNQHQTYQNQYNRQKEITTQWSQLNEVIGDATGNKYANFAQSITLRNLIALANLRLRDLNDRYLLNNDTSSDNLEVIDLYQGSTTRSISSLSGGESFILSLALALSLSDLASQNVHLESLFIDEGFGTLDAETLDTAMQTLEKLQSSSNKTIGVISHIDSIKERIHTKIVLSKNTQGHSKLDLVSG